jgi:hypothetical protein
MCIFCRFLFYTYDSKSIRTDVNWRVEKLWHWANTSDLINYNCINWYSVTEENCISWMIYILLYNLDISAISNLFVLSFYTWVDMNIVNTTLHTTGQFYCFCTWWWPYWAKTCSVSLHLICNVIFMVSGDGNNIHITTTGCLHITYLISANISFLSLKLNLYIRHE